MQKLINSIWLLSILLLTFKCSNNTEPVVKKPDAFMTLNIGDVRQYYDEKKLYIQVRVIDTLKRTDGKKVFALEESLLLDDGIYKGINYYFIENGYFKQTYLDTVKTQDKNSENPFNEQKLAQVFPENGNSFLRNLGAPDSAKIYFHIKLLDTLKTKYNTFQNVAEYTRISNSSNTQGTFYYASGYGHIGSLFTSGKDTARVFVTYLKVNGREIGKYNEVFKKSLKKIKIINKSIFRGIL